MNCKGVFVPVSQLFHPIVGHICLVLVLFAVGCRDGQQATHPVSGRLLIDGQPAAGADLRFYKVGGRSPGLARPYATTDQDGHFVVSTYGMHDGAPTGTYQVCVSWKGPPDRISPDQRDALPEQLPERFADPTTSGIEVQIIRGKNELDPIDIVP